MKDLKKKFSALFDFSWPYLVMAAMVGVFFWKFFVRGLIPLPADFVVGVYYPWLDYKWGYATGVPVKNPMTTDVVSFTYPMQTYAIDQLKAGNLPLWNPLILAGTPLLANFQSSPFSPTNFVYFLFDKVTAWSVQIILQHFLAILFTYLLLRWWKVSKIASIFGGIVFAFSGYNLIWSQWNGHALAASFMPLILLFTDRFLALGKWRDGAGISLSMMFFLLSGYPQAAIYLAPAIFILWPVRIWKNKGWFVKTFFMGIFFLLGLGLSALQILPGWELLGLSQRAIEPHPFEWAFLPWKKTITFLAADFFGNHATKNYWGPQDYTSNTGFVGVAAFILATISLSLIKKTKEVFFCFLILSVALILSFPTPVSIFLWKSGILGLNAASAHRALVLFNLSIALLSGFGLDILWSKKLRLSYLYFLPILMLIAGFAIYAFNQEGLIFGNSISKVALRNLIIPTFVFTSSVFILLFAKKLRFPFIDKAGRVSLILLSVFELFYFGWKFTPFSPRNIVFPTSPVLEFLTSQEKPFRVTGSRVIPINMRMPYGLEALEGYDAVYPLRIAQLLAALNGGRSGTDPLGRYGTVDDDTSRLLDLINTKYYLVHNLDKKGDPSPTGKVPARFTKDRFKEAFRDKSVTVLESMTALPRSFFVDEWEVIQGEEQILTRMLDPDFDFSKKIILEETPPEDTAGFIFTSDSWYPGWKAKADGKEVKIYRANFAFRAVPVLSKDSKVDYEYSPASFDNGLKISLFALALLLLFLPLVRGYTLKQVK